MNDLAGIADTALLETLAFVRSKPHAVSADEAAAALGIHRNAARARLGRLADAGLVEVGFERRTGRTGPGAGRPAKVYSAAPELSVREYPRHRLDSLVSRLVDEMPVRGRARRLRLIGEDFGRELADDAVLEPQAGAAAGVEATCAAVRSLGFQATLACVEDGHAEIETPTCPLRPLVARHPELAEIDRGMWAALVARGLRGLEAADVRCETHACLDGSAPCSVAVSFGLSAER